MASFETFEDIDSWKRARALTRRIYELTEQDPFSRDFALRDQIRRSSISVMSNIAEGVERDGNREFLQFLSIAKGSAGEVRSQLYVALDAGHIDQATFEALVAETGDILRLIGGLQRYLRQSDQRGPKYR
jgi:four helix bundle protein